MFRHMPVPRDTSISRQMIIVCCESVGNCQTLSKGGPSQLVNSIIFRPFFFSLRPMSIVLYQFCPVPTCAHHSFCTLFSCLSIDSSLYHVIFSHVTVFSVFFVKGKVEFVTLSANFDYLYLNLLWMIHNKVVWDRHYSFNRFTVRNNFLLFFNRFTLRLHL